MGYIEQERLRVRRVTRRFRNGGITYTMTSEWRVVRGKKIIARFSARADARAFARSTLAGGSDA